MTGSAKQSIAATKRRRMDCFAALAMTSRHDCTTPRRHAPECAFIFRPLEGVGNAGCPLHPRPRVRFAFGKMHTSIRVHRNHPAFPHAMVLTAYVGLSPVTGLFCHRRLADIVLSLPGWADRTPQDLTPASGRQDHTILPSAKSVSRQRAGDRSRVFRPALRSHRAPNAAASTASRPYVRDDRETPLCVGRDGQTHKDVSTNHGSEIFLQRGLDSPVNKAPDGQITTRQ